MNCKESWRAAVLRVTDGPSSRTRRRSDPNCWRRAPMRFGTGTSPNSTVRPADLHLLQPRTPSPGHRVAHPRVSAHYGTHLEIREQRQATLSAAYEVNPIRFRLLAPALHRSPNWCGSTHQNWRWPQRTKFDCVSHST